MRKISYFGILFFLVIITGCGFGVQNNSKKTEFSINEEAFIDQYQITCLGYEIESQSMESKEILKIRFSITNNTGKDTVLESKKSFQLANDKGNFYNPITEETVYLGASKTREVTVMFDLNQLKEKNHDIHMFKVLFYSGVVSNNIGFILE